MGMLIEPRQGALTEAECFVCVVSCPARHCNTHSVITIPADIRAWASSSKSSSYQLSSEVAISSQIRCVVTVTLPHPLLLPCMHCSFELSSHTASLCMAL